MKIRRRRVTTKDHGSFWKERYKLKVF